MREEMLKCKTIIKKKLKKRQKKNPKMSLIQILRWILVSSLMEIVLSQCLIFEWMTLRCHLETILLLNSLTKALEHFPSNTNQLKSLDLGNANIATPINLSHANANARRSSIAVKNVWKRMKGTILTNAITLRNLTRISKCVRKLMHEWGLQDCKIWEILASWTLPYNVYQTQFS